MPVADADSSVAVDVAVGWSRASGVAWSPRAEGLVRTAAIRVVELERIAADREGIFGHSRVRIGRVGTHATDQDHGDDQQYDDEECHCGYPVRLPCSS